MTDIPALGQCIIDWAYSNDDYTYPRSIDHIFDESISLAILDVLNEIVLDDEACAACPAEIAQEEKRAADYDFGWYLSTSRTSKPIPPNQSEENLATKKF